MKIHALILALAFTPLAYGADADSGRELYEETEFEKEINGEMMSDATCSSCHVPNDFTKADRKAENYRGVHWWVNACNQAMNTAWFPEEVDDVTAYLNREFYKFPAE